MIMKLKKRPGHTGALELVKKKYNEILNRKAAVSRAKDWYFCLGSLHTSLLSEMAIKNLVPISHTLN
jgi:hypothetical protein